MWEILYCEIYYYDQLIAKIMRLYESAIVIKLASLESLLNSII